MLTNIEEELFKIIQPIKHLKASHDGSNDTNFQSPEEIQMKEKLNVINSLKSFFKANVHKSGLALIMSKHLNVLFSKILFRFLDDRDQNIRIASDECINLIIRLTSFNFSPYIIYNIFYELKFSQSPRIIKGALQKFSSLSSFIKHSKRVSYINNVLPVLKVILSLTDETILNAIVKYLPRIAESLFPAAGDTDIDNYIVHTLVNNLENTDTVANQRLISQTIAIVIFNMKNVSMFLKKVIRHFLAVNFVKENESEIRSSLFVFKYLFSDKHLDMNNLDEMITITLKILFILENDFSHSLRNTALDCLYHLLQVTTSNNFLTFLLTSSQKQNLKDYKNLDEKSYNISSKDKIDKEEQNVNEINELVENVSLESSNIMSDFETLNNYPSEESDTNLLVDINPEDVNYLQSLPYLDSTDSVIELFDNKDDVDNNDQDIIERTDDYDNFKLKRMEQSSNSPLEHLIHIIRVDFIFDSIPQDSELSILRNRKCRVNSKVLAINILSELMRTDPEVVNFKEILINDQFKLPSNLYSVLTFCDDEDTQLNGAAFTFVGQAINMIIEKKCDYSIRTLLQKFQCYLCDVKSGQYLRSILICIKQFIWSLSCNEMYNEFFMLMSSILTYQDHNYKLVKKEILLICQSINYENILFQEQYDVKRKLYIRKSKSLADKCLEVVLHLMIDADQEIREEACECYKEMILLGAFKQHDEFICVCRKEIKRKMYKKLSLTDSIKFIPFLDESLSVTLSNIRNGQKQRNKCSSHNLFNFVHRALCMILEKFNRVPTAATRDIKGPIQKMSGYIHGLVVLVKYFSTNKTNHNYDTVPISFAHVWSSINSDHLLTLLQSPTVVAEPTLYVDLLYLTSRLILLLQFTSMPNNNFQHLVKEMFTHLCRVMNVLWHLLQFLTPIMPAHKTVLPSLVSGNQSQNATSNSSSKRRIHSVDIPSQPIGSSSLSSGNVDSRPPRTKAALGFCVTIPHCMLMHRILSVAYASSLVSPLDSQDRIILPLLENTVQAVSSILNMLSFSEIAQYAEELLSYATIFYPIIPNSTVGLIIQLLSALFGTNLVAHWDPFIKSVYQSVANQYKPYTNSDSSHLLVERFNVYMDVNGFHTQSLLHSAYLSNESITELDSVITSLYAWVKSTCRRREPAILREIANTSNYTNRPNLSHYIGLFEKLVFQCMRQYMGSSTELQSDVISLLCQLIYLRVNYCQLDSEQKFLNIIINQVDNVNANFPNEKSLIISIIEFLILLTYEKSGSQKNKPIINLTEVIRLMETLMASGISITNIVIPCIWRVVSDLFVYRTIWLNTPTQFNLLPTSESIKETELLRETLLNLILKKLIQYPEVIEIVILILEQSVREHVSKWEKICEKIWHSYYEALQNNSIMFNQKFNMICFDKMIRLLQVNVLSNNTLSIVDLVMDTNSHDLQFEDMLTYTKENIDMFMKQMIRSILCAKWIFIHRIPFWNSKSKYIGPELEENEAKIMVVERLIQHFCSVLKVLKLILNNLVVEQNISKEFKEISYYCLETIILILINCCKTASDSSQSSSSFISVENIKTVLDKVPMESINEDVKIDQYLYLLWIELNVQSRRTVEPLHESNRLCSKICKLDEWRLCQNEFIQHVRFIYQIESSEKHAEFINSIMKYRYLFILDNLDDMYVSNMLAMICRDKDLSLTFIKCAESCIFEILGENRRAMKWLNIIEKLHVCATINFLILIEKLENNILCNISLVVKFKIDLVVVSKMDCLELSSDTIFQEAVELCKKVVEIINWPFKALNKRLFEIQNSCDSNQNVIGLEHIDSVSPNEFLDERKFWRKALHRALFDKKHQDSRLAARLLQGGKAVDVEEIFGISIDGTTSVNYRLDVTEHSDKLSTEKSCNMDDLMSKLPNRFVQQCIRLGFLRSGGGLVQEGVRVDLIFRVGEKLLFHQLQAVVKNRSAEDISIARSINKSSYLSDLALLTSLNEYFLLSCQLSIPMPISMEIGNKLVLFIDEICSQIISLWQQLLINDPAETKLINIEAGKNQQSVSRLLLGQLLQLIITSLGNLSLLTEEEGMKFLNRELTVKQIENIVKLLYLLIMPFDKGVKVNKLNPLHMIVSCLWKSTENNSSKCDCHFCLRLYSALITVARLPCLFTWIRGQAVKRETGDLEIGCLSLLDRDELARVEGYLSGIGWSGRHMFEETWLLYLDLLHDSNNVRDINISDDLPMETISPEEVVEQGHCDSIGLLGLSNLLLKTTCRPYSGNPVMTQYEHKPRDKTPCLLHTKIGKKLSEIHSQLEDEIFYSLNGFKLLYSGWSFSSWNLEREESILQYRHDQININVLSKRISIEPKSSPQISNHGEDNDLVNSVHLQQQLDIISCLQSLPIICEQWLQPSLTLETAVLPRSKYPAIWPRICALRSAVILMDLFSSREQVQWLLDSLLLLTQNYKVDDDWIFGSWSCVGLAKCVAVLESSGGSTGSPYAKLTPTAPVPTSSIYGLLQAIRAAEACMHSDSTVLQQAALYSAMFLLQMTVTLPSYPGTTRITWELPAGSLPELFTFHRMIMNQLECMLGQMDTLISMKRDSFTDAAAAVGTSVINLSQTVSNKAATLASSMTVLGASVQQSLTNTNTMQLSNTVPAANNPQTASFSVSSSSLSSSSVLPKLLRPATKPQTQQLSNSLSSKSERFNLLVMATACFYCERYPEALQESDLLNNFVNLTKIVLQVESERISVSNKFVLTLCRCLERILLTQRVSNIVIEQTIRICTFYLKKYETSTYSLAVLGLFLTSCFMSLTNNTSQPCVIPASFESVFYCSPANWNPESQPVILERMNLLWKRLTDSELGSNFEHRIVSRILSNVAIEFLSGNEMLNKTIQQLLRSWPHCHFIAKSLFDMITTCLYNPDGQKEIKKWILMVLPSIVSSTPEILSKWAITIVLLASASNARVYLRSMFSQCVEWLIKFNKNESNSTELDFMFYITALAFLKDISDSEEQKQQFLQILQTAKSNIPVFSKLIQIAKQNSLII